MNTDNGILKKLGKYDVRGILGRGAMGVVYDGWDPNIDRRVAIKTMGAIDENDPGAEEARARFRNEAQAAGRLSHPSIVGVYDFGELDRTAYIVMEFIEGQTLQDKLDQDNNLPTVEAIRIIRQVLVALRFSHEKGVVHRDIKPSNVMLTVDGNIKLTDFGIARIESSTMTQAGAILGTPAYMAPEQLLGHPVDARSDIYATGVLLYQLLTGRRPFEGGLSTIMHDVLNTEPRPPSVVSASSPPALDALVGKAIAKRPEDRYQTALAFARALDDVRLDGNTPADVGKASLSNQTVLLQRRLTMPGVQTGAGGRVGFGAAAFRIGRGAASPPVLLWAAAACLVGVVGWSTLSVLGPPPLEAPHSVEPPATPGPVAPQVTEGSTSAPDGGISTTPPGTPLPGAQPLADAQPPEATTVPPRAGPSPAVTSSSTVTPPPPSISLEGPAPRPNPQAIRAALAGLTGSVACALPRYTVSEDGQVVILGPVGAGGPATALRDAVRGVVTASAAVTWNTTPVTGPYCAVLNMIRAISSPGAPLLDVSLPGESTRLTTGALIEPVVKLPGYPAYLMVDYFVSDGSVLHLLPTASNPRPEPANATVRVMERLKQQLEVSPPFGTDMVMAIASSEPLLRQVSAQRMAAAHSYLSTLSAAIDAARRRNVQVAGAILLLETRER